jgi:hypothetical protein
VKKKSLPATSNSLVFISTYPSRHC